MNDLAGTAPDLWSALRTKSLIGEVRCRFCRDLSPIVPIILHQETVEKKIMITQVRTTHGK
jgi:hypothetical protein